MILLEPDFSYKVERPTRWLSPTNRADHNRNLNSAMATSTLEDKVTQINPKTGLPFKSPWYKLAYKKRNKEKIKKQGREWARENTSIVGERRNVWRNKNREKFRQNQTEYRSDQRSKNPRFVAEENWRAAFYQLVFRLQNGGIKKGRRFDFGATTKGARTHIESQFLEGMTWDNHGKIWEVDHIKQIRLFDVAVHEEALKAFHISNVRPMWSHVNRRQQHRRVE